MHAMPRARSLHVSPRGARGAMQTNTYIPPNHQTKQPPDMKGTPNAESDRTTALKHAMRLQSQEGRAKRVRGGMGQGRWCVERA